MLPKMRYRLGLDIGATSIGWCLIRLDQQDKPIAVIRAGVRIFSDGRDPQDGASLAVTRRLARQMRRRRDRLLKRKARMMAALIRLGFFPENEIERRKLVDLDPYVLRKKGLYEPLTGGEFARALFHINQRRGFLSNRKTDKNDNDSGVLKKAIREMSQRMQQDNCSTLGEWLANRHEVGQSVRARLRGKTNKDKAYDFYADRAMIEREFDLLWDKQKCFNPDLFNDAARDELKDVLLHQRPLKPVEPGRCTFIPEQKRAPIALPSVQRFRIYQEVNNLRVLNENLTEKPPLTLQQRNQVAELLEIQKEVSFAKIRKILGLSGSSQFNLEDIKRTKLKGNITGQILSKHDFFGDRWHELDLSLQDTIVDKLLNEASETVLVKWLEEHTGIDEAKAERICDARLPEGYGNLSSMAISRILPKLINDVIPYSEAVIRAGFESHSALSHAEQTGEIMESLPYYGIPLQRHVAFEKNNPRNDEERYGKIANPTVHIGLNQLRKVVNALIKRYGHPSEIILEVARDLKLSKKRKDEIRKEQAHRQKLNEIHIAEACNVLGLNPDSIDRAKRRELSQKMQLWVELNPKDAADRRCPYTGESIGITRLLSEEVEIEHILPYSMTLDDSLNNKTIAMRRANRDKGNRTPFGAFGDNKTPGYNYPDIIERASRMTKSKAKRFAPDGYEQWLRDDKDFLARALNDTAYLSRIAKEYMSLVCPPNKVRAIPGRMTALLRSKFGLVKNRDDHRHHALDAAVVAVTDQGLLQRFAKASASARDKQLDRLVDDMPLPWPNFHEHVERAYDNIIVSFKPDHGYQGAMHEASAWGLREEGMATRRVTSDGGQRQRELKKLNLVTINSTSDAKRHGTDGSGQPVAYKGYVGGSNYCIEIWQDERGRWKGDVVTTFQAYQVIRRYGEEEGFRRLRNPTLCLSGLPLIMRLMKDDLVRLVIDGDTRTMRVVKMSGNGQIYFAGHREANVDQRNRDREDAFAYISKTAGSLYKTHARRVVVSEIGDLRDPGFKE